MKKLENPFSGHLPSLGICPSSPSLGDQATQLFCGFAIWQREKSDFFFFFTFNDTVVSRIRPKSDKVGTKILLRENLFRGLLVPPAVQLWKASFNTGVHRISFTGP